MKKHSLVISLSVLMGCAVPGFAWSAPSGREILASLAPADREVDSPLPGRLAVHPDRVSVRAVDGTFNSLVVAIDDRIVREFHAPAFRGIGVVETRRDEFRALLGRLRALNRKVLVNIGHSTTMYRDSSGDILEPSDLPIVPYSAIEQELERLHGELEQLGRSR